MRIEINEPQAIWEIGQQSEQQDTLYPKKGEADQADRIFIVANGHSNGTTSQDVIKNISGYFKRYQLASGEISDDDIRAAIDSVRPKDGGAWPDGVSLVMLCLHHEGITVVTIGNCHVFQIRPASKRLMFENKGSEKATFANPAIAHISDIEPGDYFVACTNGLMEQMDSAAILEFFSEEGSDDRKRNRLRSSTSQNKANHSALFFNIRTIVSEDGKEIVGRRPIVIPEIKSAQPIDKNYQDDEEEDDEEVVKPEKPIEKAEPKPAPVQRPQQQSARPQQPKQHTQAKHEPNPISRYDDERHQTNVRMVVLVAVIIILAIAAGMLWYFNSSSTKPVPADTTTVEPVVKDTTATTAEPADSAIIPDSAIAEPDQSTQTVEPRRKTHEIDYSTPTVEEPAEEEPSTTEPSTTEPDHKTETEPSKSATDAPKTESSTAKSSTTTE